MKHAIALIAVVLLLAGVSNAQEIRTEALLPPKAGNPRNSEGGFVPLKDGRVLFVYTHFTGGAADNAKAHLASRVSTDGGLTWTKEDVTVPSKEAGENVMSVSLLRLKDGRIALFYLVKNSGRDCRLYMHTSQDEARTWSEPTLCIPDDGYYVVNNDRVIQLSTGRLVVPAAQHWSALENNTHRGVALCYLSDDAGKTWRRSKSQLRAPERSRSGLQEPAVVELRDGRLMMLNRTDQGSQFISYSSDQGETWTEATPSELASPLSPVSIERIPSTGDLLLVWNDHVGVAPNLRGKRTPLTVAISKDDGKTWEKRKNVETDPDGWYCYTAIEFVGDRVLLAYCGGKNTAKLALTQMTSLPVKWLYE